MAYPKSFIEELKLRNNITDVVGRYVTLKRSGSNMSGLCPFHSERSPSFTVFSDHFHCFGCGAGGDVITFTMKIENLDYRSAIELLAQRAGIDVPQEEGYTGQRKEILSRERGLLMNKLAARRFHENLMKAPEAEPARKYIAQRGIDVATVRHFGLGFAKNDFHDMLDFLRGEGFTTEEIKECFLCAQSQKGNYYDIFRNRIMFPIIDVSGNVVAFGGRVMDDSKPKYLNSSDTPVFKKSRNLFAMNFAKNSALGDKNKKDAVSGNSIDLSGQLIMCEGYMDVIALHKAGFTNAVATLGTAITQEHARFVSRYANTVYLAYDSDNAGKSATAKAIKLLSEVGIDAKVIKIVGAKDPDEYIKSYGSAAFGRLLSGSVGQVDYRLNEILAKYNLEISDEKIKAVGECCELFSEIYPEYKREIYISRLSEITGVSKDSCEREIKRRQKKKSAGIMRDAPKTGIEQIKHYNDKVNAEASKYPKGVELEERILGIMILYPEFISELSEKLLKSDFMTEFSANVYEKLQLLFTEDRFDMTYLNEYFTPEQTGRILMMAEKRKLVSSNGKEAIYEAVDALKKEKSAAENKGSFLDRINARKQNFGVNKDDKNTELE